MAQPLSARGAKQYAELQEAMAEAYGVERSSRMFSVEPSIAQELNDAITAKADFLERINVTPVSEIKGEKVFIGVNGPVTGRTNTKTTDREAKDASALDNTQYELADTFKVKLYKRAVYCRTKANLLPQFATITRRESAENTGKEAPERAETFLAFSQQAIRAVQGRGRITASLQ